MSSITLPSLDNLPPPQGIAGVPGSKPMFRVGDCSRRRIQSHRQTTLAGSSTVPGDRGRPATERNAYHRRDGESYAPPSLEHNPFGSQKRHLPPPSPSSVTPWRSCIRIRSPSSSSSSSFHYRHHHYNHHHHHHPSVGWTVTPGRPKPGCRTMDIGRARFLRRPLPSPSPPRCPSLGRHRPSGKRVIQSKNAPSSDSSAVMPAMPRHIPSLAPAPPQSSSPRPPAPAPASETHPERSLEEEMQRRHRSRREEAQPGHGTPGNKPYLRVEHSPEYRRCPPRRMPRSGNRNDGRRAETTEADQYYHQSQRRQEQEEERKAEAEYVAGLDEWEGRHGSEGTHS